MQSAFRVCLGVFFWGGGGCLFRLGEIFSWALSWRLFKLRDHSNLPYIEFHLFIQVVLTLIKFQSLQHRKH